MAHVVMYFTIIGTFDCSESVVPRYNINPPKVQYRLVFVCLFEDFVLTEHQ